MNNNLPTTFNTTASPANANHAVITVRGLSKRYVMHERRMSLRQEAGQIARRWLHGDKPRPDEDYYWALRSVSFDVFSGERVAIIGRNGAGKTTLLRALSGITAPTEGTISVHGKAVALIGLGAGFDTARTGRENIFLNAAIYGVMPGETRTLVDAIIDFSELKDFIDTPVKRYSSGMVARLGFSIAIHILPDIVMLDEVLSVGDVAFQEKCVARIRELRARSSTVLFVSHSIKAAADLCERAIWLHRGALMMDGATDTVIEAYREMLRQSAEA